MRRRQRTSEPASALGPAALVLERDRVRLGESWLASFAVVGYPSEVARGWLAPLLRAARDADVALHVEPVPPAVASERLRRQRARLESTRRLERERGMLPDPWVAAFEAAEDTRPDDMNDLWPGWTYPGDARVNVWIPHLPLSREIDRYTKLQRQRALYRIAIGQLRQETMLAIAAAHGIDGGTAADDLRIDLRPPNQTAAGEGL